MSLRLRLFLLMGGLVAMLVAAQWWWVRVLTRDLSSELDIAVATVGKSVVALFRNSDQEATGFVHETRSESADCEEEDCQDEVTRHFVHFDNEDEVVATIERSVVVEKFRADEKTFGEGSEKQSPREPESQEAPHRAFAFRYEARMPPGSDSEHLPELLEKHLKLHVEHKGDDRFLWMGEPSTGHRIRIPQQGFKEKLETFRQRMLFGSVGFLTLGLALTGLLAHRVTGPLRQLAGAARRLGEGDLGTQVEVQARGEVGETIHAFNHMSGRLEELDDQARSVAADKHLGEIGEIARGLAHTLRNPLNALGLSVEELAGRAGSEGAAPELAESAKRQIRRIDHSIRSFLALASQSGGVLSAVDLGELIEDVALEALQDGRGKVRLEIDLAEDLPTLRGVEPELRAVLQALVVNAVEASPPGGTVTLRALAQAPGRIRVELEDQGPGLAPEIRERLFTPHLSTKANGSGMGLFLAHRIATQRYDGRLELLDRQGEPAEASATGTRALLEIGERDQALSDGPDADEDSVDEDSVDEDSVDEDSAEKRAQP